MTELHEALSRLLDGDLSDADASALRQRIEAEPEVARAWQGIHALTAALREQPDLPVPPGLNERVLAGSVDTARPDPAPPSTHRWLGWSGWLAAAALLLVLWPGAQPEVLLVEGSEFVDGQALLLAGDARVHVDGRVAVSVEPPPTYTRETGSEAAMSTTSHLAAALVGAVVTVTVYEGSARVEAPERSAVTIGAGETRSFGPIGGATVVRPLPGTTLSTAATAAGGPPADAAETKAELRAHIARLESELEQSRFESGLARGQLARLEGDPQPWPDDVPEYLDPAVFEDRLLAALEEHDIGDLVSVDCEEFPCIAFIRSAAKPDALHDAMGEIADMLLGDVDAPVMQTLSRREDDDRAETLIGLTPLPLDHELGLGDRIEFRTKSLMSELGAPTELDHELE